MVNHPFNAISEQSFLAFKEMIFATHNNRLNHVILLQIYQGKIAKFISRKVLTKGAVSFITSFVILQLILGSIVSKISSKIGNKF